MVKKGQGRGGFLPGQNKNKSLKSPLVAGFLNFLLENLKRVGRLFA
jgi:hypothetical protein